jgi:glyoxalase/bleomycin resistance protein/dioxygenase superfamily protein
MAITGMHALFYTPHAEELREFIRDKLGFTFTDVGGGWLIFDVPTADLAVHPSDDVAHEVSFFCEDIEVTVADLRSKGVDFTSEIQEQDWGRLISFEMPGGVTTLLYEPKYAKNPA